MRSTAHPAAEAAVVFACAGCGRSIVLTAVETGVEIQDAPAFLRVHAQCLKRLSTDERRIELPD
jgi:hypothetical protein